MMEPSVGVALGACRSSYHDGFSFVALFTCITALVLYGFPFCFCLASFWKLLGRGWVKEKRKEKGRIHNKFESNKIFISIFLHYSLLNLCYSFLDFCFFLLLHISESYSSLCNINFSGRRKSFSPSLHLRSYLFTMVALQVPWAIRVWWH